MFDPNAPTIACPGDLSLLKRVYDRICAERELGPGSPQAANLAKRAMALFADGLFEEEEIYEQLCRY